MDIILKIVLVLLGILVFGLLNYLIHVRLRKRARDVEMEVTLAFDKFTDTHYITVMAPFYDEKLAFYLGFSLRGIHLGFTPLESMAEVFRDFFRGKSIAQTCYDSYDYPDMRGARGIVSEMRQDGVEILNGVLIYSPDAVERGCLEYGVTDGLDRYLVFSGDYLDRKFEFERNVEELRKNIGIEAIKKEKSIFRAEGEMVKFLEAWTLFHNDKGILLGFANAALHKGIRKLFKLNKLEVPEDFHFPALEKIFQNFDNFAEKRDVIKLYFDNDDFVIYRERGKKYETFSTKIMQLPPKSKLQKILSSFVPEMASPRAYSRTSLQKMGFKLIKSGVIIAAIIFGLEFIMIEILDRGITIMIAIACVLSVFCVGSLVIGLYYILRGLLSRKKFIKVGI